MSIILVWLSGFIFALFHSLTASNRFKEVFYGAGMQVHHYRLLYSVVGIYRFVRHPMYAGAMLILLSMPEQTVNGLNLALIVCLYFIVGSKLEEKRMLLEHPSYAKYQNEVPAFIPKLMR